MTLTKMQAMLGVATIILTITSVIGGAVASLETRFAALDTRMAKLESAIKAINSEGPDEKYRQLVKELMAQRDTVGPEAPNKAGAQGVHTFGGPAPADAGASASSPAMVKPR